MIDIDELANQIHADVFDVAKSGIPLGVFPNVFQKIAFELVNYENFNLEYTVAIMLSAFATAIGNTYHVRIKGKCDDQEVLHSPAHGGAADEEMGQLHLVRQAI